MRIIFLGTAGSTPTKFRGLPSIAIEREGELLLFDCGEGTQRQMMQFSVNISKITAIFLTHTHGDHTLGVAGLVRTLALNRRTRPLDIFIPAGGEKQINELIHFDNAVMNYKINVKPVRQGEIYRGKGFAITAFRLLHTTKTYGFVLKEDDKIKFLKQKAAKLGIKGKAFATLLKSGQLKVGKRTIKLKEVSFKEPGKRIVYATDTRPTNDTVKAAANADILIHETTYSASELSLAKERMHSTAVEGATLAKKAKAKKLVITHPSARYRDDGVLVGEARKIFKNTEMAKDGMIIEI
jgi:ribonuclease Z